MPGWIIDDAARLATLHDFGILDTGQEDRFDEIASAASAACDTPVALVSLIDRDRQWFKAKVGTDITETPVEAAICSHTLAHGGELVIPDLTTDPRTAANPLVTGDPWVRFYAGVPIVIDGQAVGTVCVLDVAPREGLTQPQRRALTALATDAARMIEER